MAEINVLSLITLMGIPTAITGFCFWMLQRQISRRDKRTEELEKARKQNEILVIQSVGAAMALSEAAAVALKNGHTNGETEKALEYARQVKHKQKDFLIEQGVDAIY